MKATLMLLLLAPLASATTPIVIPPQINPTVRIVSPAWPPTVITIPQPKKTKPIVVPPRKNT